MFPTMMTPTPMTEEAFKQAVTHGYTEQMQKAIASPVIRKDSTLAKKYRTKEAIANALYHLLGFDEKEDRDGRSLTGWMLRPDQSGVAPLLEEINRRRAQAHFDKLDKDKCEAVALVLYLVNENHNINPDSWEKLLSDLIDIEAGDIRTGYLTKSRLPKERMISANAPLDRTLLDSASGERVLLPTPAFRNGKTSACIPATYVFQSKLQPHDFNVLLTAFNVAMHNRDEDKDGFVEYWATTEAIAKSYFPNAQKITETAIETITDSLARLSACAFRDVNIDEAVKNGVLPKGFRAPQDDSPLWTGKRVKIVTGEHEREKSTNKDGKKINGKAVGNRIVSGWVLTEKPFLFKISEEWKRIRKESPAIRPKSIGYDSETEAIYSKMVGRLLGVQWQPTNGKMRVDELLALSSPELTARQRSARIDTINAILTHWDKIRLCHVERIRSKKGISKSDWNTGRSGTLEAFDLSLPQICLETGKKFDQADPKWKHKAEAQMRAILFGNDEEYVS